MQSFPQFGVQAKGIRVFVGGGIGFGGFFFRFGWIQFFQGFIGLGPFDVDFVVGFFGQCPVGVFFVSGLNAVFVFVAFLTARGFVQGNAWIFFALFGAGDVLLDVFVILIGLDAFAGGASKGGEKAADLVERFVFGLVDAVGFQSAREFAFAGAEVVHDRGQGNIGGDAVALGGGAVNAVEF